MPLSETPQRLELLAEDGGRRTWPDEKKVAHIARRDGPGFANSVVARWYRLIALQLATWRRLARTARRQDETGVSAARARHVQCRPARAGVCGPGLQVG